MRLFGCLSPEFPAGDECLPLRLCAYCSESKPGKEGLAEETSLLCLFSELCVQLRTRADRSIRVCVCVCRTGLQVARSWSAAHIQGYITGHHLAWLCGWVCRWVGSSGRDSQRSTSVWPAGDPADTSPTVCSQELVEDYPSRETFMEFSTSFLALYTGITSACSVIHTRVNISSLKTEVQPHGLLLPFSVIGRFWTCQCMLAGWNILGDKREECAAVCVPIPVDIKVWAALRSIVEWHKHVVFCGGTEGTGKLLLFSVSDLLINLFI